VKSGHTGKLIPGKFFLFFLSILFLIGSRFHCAMLPELEQSRNEKITKGPDFSPYYGLKRRIAVLDFENRSALGSEKLGSAVADMLVNQLFRSGRFTLIERSRIDQILQEQALGQSGAIAEETAPRVGQLLGVDCLILGKILEADQETGSREVENKKDAWKFLLKATLARINISYKVVKTTTGEIVLADEISASEIKPGFGLETKDFDFKNMYEFDQTVLGIATRKAVNKISQALVDQVDRIDWVGKVVQAQADTVIYFTPGKGAGVQLNQLFEIYERPDFQTKEESPTEDLMPSDQPKARIQVAGFIGDKVARARVIEGTGIKTGDLVKLAKSSAGYIQE